MKKLLFSAVSICIFVSVIFLILQGQKKEILTGIQANSAPENIVKLYINSAIKGDEETVKSIVVGVPDSYSSECIKTKVTNSRPDPDATEIVLPETEKNNEDLDYLNSYSSDKFANLSNPKSKLSLAFSEASYIYTTNNIFSDIKISNTEIYGDKAIVYVDYIISEDSKSRRRFLLKKDAGWKVFTTESLDISSSIINRYYAKPRPNCE